MKQKIIYLKCCLWFFMLLCFISTQGNAQSIKRQSIASYGSVASIDHITFLQTGGQPFYSAGSYENENSILQGFQQPIKFSVEKINSLNVPTLNLTVYPNPATYSVKIKSQEIAENVTIQVTDLSGKLLLNEKVPELNIYTINCENWINGVYFIRITGADLSVNSSKLIINK